MRHCVSICLTVCVSLLFANFAFSDTTLYVSFTNFEDASPTNLANENPEATFVEGDTGTAYIWIQTDTDIDMLSVANILLDNASVVSLSQATVFNPDILLNNGNVDGGDRWDATEDGQTSATGDSISGLLGFTTGGEAGPFSAAAGIRPSLSQIQTDALYDPNSDSFLFAQIEFEAIGAGSVAVNPSGIFLNEGDLANFSVVSGTINVTSAIPEPASASVMLLVSMLALSRRRR